MTLKVAIVSREGEAWSGEARHVQLPTTAGSMGVLSGRQPLLGILAPGKVVVDLLDGSKKEFHVTSGFASVDSDVVTVAMQDRPEES